MIRAQRLLIDLQFVKNHKLALYLFELIVLFWFNVPGFHLKKPASFLPRLTNRCYAEPVMSSYVNRLTGLNTR